MSLHLRATSETQDFLDEAKLRLMKPTAFLVNTSRGSVVDEEALALALREGWIAGAGIDVYETEPPPSDSELLGLDNIVLSPHAAWCSERSAHNIRHRILRDIYRCFDNQRPEFTVNEEVDKVLNGRAYRQVE